MMKKESTLYVIAGPTAVGKTRLSLEIANFLKCPIISADSRQFYKEMSIGTAKPTEKELEMADHYFVNNKSIEDLYSAGEYEKDVLKWLNNHFQKNKNALLVGGSGMYINAVCNGLDNLPRDLNIRAELNNKLKSYGIKKLQDQLQKLDPIHFKNIDINNPQRVIRAIEVCMITNSKYSSLLKRTKITRPFNIVKILLHLNKTDLKNRIEKRVDQMVDKGLFKEVKSLIKYRKNNALNTVGYKEIFDYYDELHNKDEAISKIKTNTKKYAKRQMTWFKKDKDYIWIDNKEPTLSFKKIKDIIT